MFPHAAAPGSQDKAFVTWTFEGYFIQTGAAPVRQMQVGNSD